MSETFSTQDDLNAALAALRAELDRLDDGLHDLLMRRAEVVEKVGALGAKGRVPFRPGREAAIVHRLLARHTGSLPRRAIVRIWRELLAATTAMQGNYIIAVAETANDGAHGGLVALGREHFGSSTDMRIHSSPAQALADVSAGTAVAAVLPVPGEDDPPGAAWWTALLQPGTPRIHIVARLPFWAPRAEGATQMQALVVTVADPDPSPHDHTLIGFEVPGDISRAHVTALFNAAGLPPLGFILRSESARRMALVTVDGFVTASDPRLAMIASQFRPVVLGAYAKSVDGETK